MDFPYKRNFISFEEILGKFENLRMYPLERAFKGPLRTRGNHRFERGFLSYAHREEDYEMMDVICDYFQEHARLSARLRNNKFSPMEMWEMNVDSLQEKTASRAMEKFGRVDGLSLRESFYEFVRECTQFRPSFAVFIFKMFNVRRVLDFSAGWGDRLIGAIAAGVELYRGFDPNTNLRSGHEEIMTTFKAPKEFSITYEPFEDSGDALEDEFFDMVFTSPPFFDYEIYSDRETQSVSRYRSLKKWKEEFLFKSVSIAWRKLKKGGVLGLYVSDVGGTKYVQHLNDYISRLSGARFMGVINQTDAETTSRTRPTWFHQKMF